MKFCPTCRYYMVLEVKRKEKDVEDDDAEETATLAGGKPACSDKLYRTCRVCGYQEEEETGGVILEIDLQEKTSEGYKVLLNEFTKFDPTLPHVSNIVCRNDECRSRTGGAKPDVIYIKYDAVNMKYLYICTVCDAQWRSA
jgi:hypothetical protein